MAKGLVSCEICGFSSNKKAFFFPLRLFPMSDFIFYCPTIPHKPQNIKLKDEILHTIYCFILLFHRQCVQETAYVRNNAWFYLDIYLLINYLPHHKKMLTWHPI
jgi:hypothetical protein